MSRFSSVASAPNPAKAPWYFLGLQEMLVYFDPWMAGVVYPGLIIVGLMAIPFIFVRLGLNASVAGLHEEEETRPGVASPGGVR